jgi:hypothetical protein
MLNPLVPTHRGGWHGYEVEGRPMRGLRAVGLAAVLLGVAAASLPVGALDRDESAPAAVVGELRSRAGYTKIANAKFGEPVLGDVDFEIEAAVLVETGNSKHARAVECPLFVVDHDDPKWTIKAICEADKAARGKLAQLEVTASSTVSNAFSACGNARALQRHTRLACSVWDPSAHHSR